MTISERIEAGRRERRVLIRVSRAAWRLEQAERERTWALASARAEGISIRTLAAAAGLSPSRVHQLAADADMDALDAALGELRQRAGPPPKIRTAGRTPNWTAGTASPTGCPMRWAGCGSARAGSRTWTLTAARRRSTCARPPTGQTGPSWPWTWRGWRRSSAASPPTWTNSPGPGGSRTWTPPRCCLTGGRNAAGGWPSRTWSSGPSAPAGAARFINPQLERAWDAWQAERYQRGETGQRPGYTDNPFRPRSTTRATAHTRAVQETGRSSGAHGSVVTGTPEIPEFRRTEGCSR